MKSNELRAMRRLFRLVRVLRLNVRVRILKRGKKKNERRKRRVGIQRRIRELADKNDRVFSVSFGERFILKFQPQMNTSGLDVLSFLFICVHLCE